VVPYWAGLLSNAWWGNAMTGRQARKLLLAWQSSTDEYARWLVQEHLPKGIGAYPETELKVCARRIALALETYYRTGRRRGDPYATAAEAEQAIDSLYGPR